MRFERPSFAVLAWLALAALVGARYFVPRTPPAAAQPRDPHAPHVVTRGSAAPMAAASPDGMVAGASVSPAQARERAIFAQDAALAGDPDLIRDYDDINAKHFGGSLPSVPVLWEAELADVGPLIAAGFTLNGVTDGQHILVNAALKRDPDKALATLCHEMAHIATQGAVPAHGPEFQAVLRRLSEEGAFKGVWASREERSSLGEWLRQESARLNAEAAALEIDATGIDAARWKREADMADMDARIAAANARGTGWPQKDEITALNARNDTFNQQVTTFNARVEQHRQDAAHFDAEAQRYNLIMAYPDGLDESSLVQPARPAPATRSR